MLLLLKYIVYLVCFMNYFYYLCSDLALFCVVIDKSLIIKIIIFLQ